MIIDRCKITDDHGNLLYLSENGVVDSKNNIHIFNNYQVDKDGRQVRRMFYSKIDSTGTFLIENRSMEEINTWEPQLEIDSQDNIHIVWEEEDHIYYTKLDDSGNKLIDKMTIV